MKNRVYDPIHDTFQPSNDTSIISSETSSENINAKTTTDSSNNDTNVLNNNISSTDTIDSTNNSTISNTNEISNNFNVNSSFNNLSTNIHSNSPHSSRRHLKKADGAMFTRHDIQFNFLNELFKNEKPLYTNIYKTFFTGKHVPIKDSLNYNAQSFIFNDKLTFIQLYIATLLSSERLSRVLREKLLNDQNFTYINCLLCLLINFGKLNTTINFSIEMSSQLRTFNSIPSMSFLVQNDPTSNNNNSKKNSKLFQDTPRLKSILKSLPIGNDPISLSSIYEFHSHSNFNIVNLLFSLINNHATVDVNIIKSYVKISDGSNIDLFRLLDDDTLNTDDRINVFLWLCYIHLETNLSSNEIINSIRIFSNDENNNNFFTLRLADDNELKLNCDTPEEINFGNEQMKGRKDFLATHKKIFSTTTTTANLDENSINSIIDENSAHASADENVMENGQKEPIDDSENTDGIEINIKDDEESKSDNELENQNGEATFSTESSPTKVIKPVSQIEDQSEKDNLFDSWLAYENGKTILSNKDGSKISQKECRELLNSSRILVQNRRKRLGLLRLYAEHEDAPLAPGIGIRGRKKRKFKDGVLGFETDFMYVLKVAKKVWNDHEKKNFDNINKEEFFSL